MRLAALLLIVVGLQSGSTLRPDAPKVCDSCEAWNRPLDAFRVFGNTYYVGTEGLGAVLVTSAKGHVLLDGGLPQSAPRIDENIRKAGFKLEDVRLIVNSHAHYDHAGGIAALQRASGADVAASEWGARVLERGETLEDDPQHGYGRDAMAIPPVSKVRVVRDGDVLRVGETAITARLTPGHTPGSTTWTWKSCEGARCVDVVYADSLNAVSAPGFRFTDASRGGAVDTFRRSIATVRNLPCDVLLTVHPQFAQLTEKLARTKTDPNQNAFIDPQACRRYTTEATTRLDARIADERK